MAQIMEQYSDNTRYYSRLVGHGYQMLAEAIEADLPYDINCPCLLVCVEKDMAGDTKRFNHRSAAGENLPIKWAPGAGHNSCTDCPEMVNSLIEKFVAGK